MILSKESLCSDRSASDLELSSHPREQYSPRPLGVLTALLFLALISLVGINSALAQAVETNISTSAETLRLDIILAEA